MGKSDLQKVQEFMQSPAPGSPEEDLERELREAFDRMRDRQGRKVDYNVSARRVNPGRTLVTKLAKAKRKGVARAEVLRIERALQRYIDRRWPKGEDGSEFSKAG